MTEITDKKVRSKNYAASERLTQFLVPKSRKPRYLIDPSAFIIALIGGPMVVTVLFFWIYFIPVFALVFGGPIYLIVGTPVLLIYLRRYQANVSYLMLLALVTILMLFPILGLFSVITQDQRTFEVGSLVLGFGLIFGPLWAGTFGSIYLKLQQDFYTVAHPI